MSEWRGNKWRGNKKTPNSRARPQLEDLEDTR